MTINLTVYQRFKIEGLLNNDPKKRSDRTIQDSIYSKVYLSDDENDMYVVEIVTSQGIFRKMKTDGIRSQSRASVELDKTEISFLIRKIDDTPMPPEDNQKWGDDLREQLNEHKRSNS